MSQAVDEAFRRAQAAGYDVDPLSAEELEDVLAELQGSESVPLSREIGDFGDAGHTLHCALVELQARRLTESPAGRLTSPAEPPLQPMPVRTETARQLGTKIHTQIEEHLKLAGKFAARREDVFATSVVWTDGKEKGIWIADDQVCFILDDENYDECLSAVEARAFGAGLLAAADQLDATKAAAQCCGNCAYWDPHGTYASSPFRPCRAVIHDENYLVGEGLGHKLDFDPEAELQERMAEEPELRAEVEAMRKQHKAVVQDGSGFNAALKTREDFGCVLWAAKR